MGKPTGFKEFQRQIPNEHDPRLRILNWNEFHEHMSDTELRTQGARCMDCGVPFCHTGCPLGNLIPDWNDLIYRDRWREAIARLREHISAGRSVRLTTHGQGFWVHHAE